MRKTLLIFIILFAYTFSISWGQNNQESPNSFVDSNLRKLELKLQESELQRVRDSVRNAILILELQNSKGAKNDKEIKSQINKIKEEDSLQIVAQKTAIQELKKTTKGFPVTLFNDTIFTIYTSMGSFSPSQRAEEAQHKILDLFSDNNYTPDSLTYNEVYGLTNIIYNKQIIYSIGGNDALWEDTTARHLAEQIIANINLKVDKNKKLYSWQNIAIRWTKALLVVAVVGICLILITKIFNRLSLFIARNQNKFVKEIKIRKYELFSKRYLYGLFQRFIILLKYFFIGLIIYVGITFLLSIFPATHRYTNLLFHWIVDPIKRLGISIYNYLPNLIEVIILILLFRYIIRIVRYFSIEVEKGDLKIRGFHPEWSKPTYSIIRLILIAFSLILIFPNLPGSDSKAFQGISVFIGVLLSLGSSSAISNSIAGFIITYMRPFRKGDWIKVGTTVGYVKEKTLLVTRITTINNEDVTIPNSTILTSQTTNYSSTKNHDGLAIAAEVTMAYAVPWRTIHEVLLKAAELTPHLNRNKKPFILQQALESYYVKYSLNVYTKQPEKMYYIHTELLKNIQDCFKEAGLDLHLPQQISIVNQNMQSYEANTSKNPLDWAKVNNKPYDKEI